MSADEQYTPDEEHMEVAWIEYDDAATDINEAAAQFDRFLARVRRDAAREALDGLARDLAATSGDAEAEEVRDHRDTHCPETED